MLRILIALMCLAVLPIPAIAEARNSVDVIGCGSTAVGFCAAIAAAADKLALAILLD